MSVLINASKTDKYSKGTHIYIGCSKHPVCAYCAMQSYVESWPAVKRSTRLVPLFQLQAGAVLSKSLLVQQTKLYLSIIGINPSSYSGHSFRIGGATSMASAGMGDWEIKLGGRWTSDTYQRYIRAPPSLMAGFASRMVTTSKSAHTFRNPYIHNIFKYGFFF